MERLTYLDGGKWRVRLGDTEYSGPWVDHIAAYEEIGTVEEFRTALRRIAEDDKAREEGRLVGTCTYSQEDIDSGVYNCSACGAVWGFTTDGPIENNTNYCPECGAKITHVSIRALDEDGDVIDRVLARQEAEAALGGGEE